MPGCRCIAIMGIAMTETRPMHYRGSEPVPVPPVPYYSAWWIRWVETKAIDDWDDDGWVCISTQADVDWLMSRLNMA